MPTASLQSRPHHAFLSYDHTNIPLVEKLHHWLTNVAGLSIWLDSRHLGTGRAVAAALGNELMDCRALLLILSKASVQSEWVVSEVESALHEAQVTPGFNIVTLRVEECEIPRTWGALRTRKWIEVPAGELTLQSAWELLMALQPRADTQAHKLDVFVSCGWRERESRYTEAVCRLLSAKGARLIGDSPDQKHFSAGDRVASIMQGCSAHVAILPQRAASATNPEPYKYFVREVELAPRFALPQLIICESNETLPAGLRDQSHELSLDAAEARANPTGPFLDALDGLFEEVKTPPLPPFAFLAAEYGRHDDRNRFAQLLIERIAGMPCLMGSGFTGEQLRQRIIDHIRRAQFLLGDLAAAVESDGGALKINLNTCVEAGIAMGARVHHYLLSLAPAGTTKTDKLPFMFRDHQINYYQNDIDFLGLVHKLSHPHRRRVLNSELGL